jgi:hypothetical protein
MQPFRDHKGHFLIESSIAWGLVIELLLKIGYCRNISCSRNFDLRFIRAMKIIS